MSLTLGVVILGLLVFYAIVTSDLEALHKFGIAVIELGIVGMILKKIVKPTKNWRIDGDWGLLLLKTKKGLKLIDKLTKNKKLWNNIVDIGVIASYGFLSYFIMRKHFTWKKFIGGMLLLTIISMFIAPYAIPFLMSSLKGQVMGETASAKYTSDEVFAWIGLAITYGFGLFGVVFSGIVQYGIIILGKVVGTFMGTETLTQDSAGATLLLPGINIPFIEGIIALFIILLVHEGGHAVLGRIAKVPMESTGLVLFGVIPIGAFVEPDEKYLNKLDTVKQTRVIVAGPTLNFMTAIITFILFMGFINVTQDYRESGLLVLEGMEYETIIYSVNGVNIQEVEGLVSGETVTLQTNKGEIDRVVNEEGLLGVRGYQLNGSFVVRYTQGWMNFIYTTLGLIFSLNFIIGIINLLPIPAFDGWRVIELNIKNKTIVNILMYSALVGLLMNFVPWLF